MALEQVVKKLQQHGGKKKKKKPSNDNNDGAQETTSSTVKKKKKCKKPQWQTAPPTDQEKRAGGKKKEVNRKKQKHIFGAQHMQHGVCTSQQSARDWDTNHPRRRRVIKLHLCSSNRQKSKDRKTLTLMIHMRNESWGGLQCL